MEDVDANWGMETTSLFFILEISMWGGLWFLNWLGMHQCISALFYSIFHNQQTVRDFIGMVVKNGVLFCVYKLGGRFYEIKTSEITMSNSDKAFMDRVDFRR